MAVQTMEKTARCRIFFEKDGDWIEVQSLKTGCKMRLDVSQVDNAWDFLTKEESVVCDWLMARQPRTDANVSYSNLRSFKLLCERQAVETARLDALETEQPIIVGTPLAPMSNGAEIIDIEPQQTNGVYVPQPAPAQQIAPVVQDKTDTVSVIVKRTLRREMAGATTQERELLSLEGAVNKLRGEVWQLVYDIPAKSKRMTNPSSWLWRYGFRFTESSWIMLKPALESPVVQRFIKDMTEASAADEEAGSVERHECYATHIDSSMVEQMRDLAWRRLAKMLQEVHASLIQRIANADKKLREAEEENTSKGYAPSWKERQQIQSKRDNAVRGIIRDAGSDLNDAIACAQQFDETERVKDVILAVKAAVLAEQKAFNAHAAATRVNPCRLARIGM